MNYEVIESKVWVNSDTGAKASIYGASPWPFGASEAERAKWAVKPQGWTVRNPLTGDVGIGRAPCATKAEAEALAVKLGRPSAIGIGS